MDYSEISRAAQRGAKNYGEDERNLYEIAFTEGAMWMKSNGQELCSLKEQIGGEHYKGNAIQPVEYAHANKLDFLQGSVVKYVTRFRDKNGVEDLKKAMHFIQMLAELEYGQKI